MISLFHDATSAPLHHDDTRALLGGGAGLAGTTLIELRVSHHAACAGAAGIAPGGPCAKPACRAAMTPPDSCWATCDPTVAFCARSASCLSCAALSCAAASLSGGSIHSS